MRKDKWKRIFRQKEVMAAAGIMLVAAIGMTGVYVSEEAQKKDQAKVEQESTEQLKDDTAGKSKTKTQEPQDTETEKVEDVSNILTPAVTTDEGADVADVADVAEKTVPDTDTEDAAVPTGMTSENLSFSQNSELLWPVEGNVIMNYSMDQTIYYATLDQYRCNPAVVIQGDVNEKVSAAADGIITDVSNNAETGLCVTMDLGNGYTATYGQLKEVPFNAGAYVEAGDVIGYISEPTKYYSVEGSNLYFELCYNGEPVDPVTFFE